MTTIRAKRSARIRSHPDEPELKDVLEKMRDKDLYELLKLKRKGELDQFLQGLFVADVPKNAPLETAFSASLRSFGSGLDNEIGIKDSEDAVGAKSREEIIAENEQKMLSTKWSSDEDSKERNRKSRLGLIVEQDTPVYEVSKEIKIPTLMETAPESPIEGKSIKIRESSIFIKNGITPARTPNVPSTSSPDDFKNSPDGGESSEQLVSGTSDNSDIEGLSAYKAIPTERSSTISSNTNNRAYRNSLRKSWRMGTSMNGSLGGSRSNTLRSYARNSEGDNGVLSSDFDDTDTDRDQTISSSVRRTFKGNFTYDQLKNRANQIENPFPAGIDTRNREQYLTDDEFEFIFKMSKADFNRQTKWRRQELKKRYNLF